MQIADTVNNALDAMRAAGATLVPFDSSGLIDVGLLAWGGVQPKSSAYETSDTTSRQALSARISSDD